MGEYLLKNGFYNENPFGSPKKLLTAPLYEKHQVRRAVVKSTTALFPFMLFAAMFAFMIIPLSYAIPTLESGLYWVSYMSIQLFGIGFSAMLAYNLSGLFPCLVAGVLSAYFGVFCTQTAGIETVSGSSVIGFMGYYLIGLMSAAAVEYLHRVCVVVIEWGFSIVFKLAHSKITDEKKREGLICGLRPMLKNMVLLGDSLVVMALAVFILFFIMNFLYALPMTIFATKVSELLAHTDNSVLQGAIIGFAVGFDVGGPVSLSVFGVIFDGLLNQSVESARLMTVFSAAMITPSWICMIYLFVGKKFKQWPMVCYDENLLNTGFINEVFQNVRLMAMSPMAYAIREARTVPFAFIAGTTVTGILSSVFGITNNSLLTNYALKYGLLRHGTVVITEKYDAFAGLMPPLYAGGGIKVILLSFVAAAVGAGIGVTVLVFLKKLRYSRQHKRGEDLFLAFGYTFTKAEWEAAYAGKSNLEKRLGFDKTKKGQLKNGKESI